MLISDNALKNNTHHPISVLLHCAPMPIPSEYQNLVKALAREFVKFYSIPNIKRLDYEIVYNRACNRVNDLIKSQPLFSLRTFDRYLNIGNLFYCQNDIDILVNRYKSAQWECIDYVFCFFAVKLKNTKKLYARFTKELDPEDVDATLQLGLFTTLEDYAPDKGNFSFEYLDRQLRTALFNFIADSNIWGLNRNLFPQYRHMCALFSKYNLSLNDIERFLYEIQLSKEEAAKEDKLYFKIDPSDKDYSFANITINKAKNFYHLYLADSFGITQDIIYDTDNDALNDMTSGIPEQGYIKIDLQLYIEQTFPSDAQKYIVNHIIETASTRFTAEDLAFGNVTRYEINKVIERLRKDFK